MSNKQITQNVSIHPGGDGLAIPPATAEPPTGAIGCSGIPELHVVMPDGGPFDPGVAFQSDSSLQIFCCEDNWYYVTFGFPMPVGAEKDYPQSDSAYIGLWIQAELGPPKVVRKLSLACPFPNQEIRVAKSSE